jgi:dipeptidyl aminopeptidase/acylaminoacyl peptidase
MNRLALVCVILGVLTYPLYGRERVAAAARPSIEELLRMKTFPVLMPISVSPDGKYIAYTLQDGARVGETTDAESMDERAGSGRLSRGCEIWVAYLESGRQVQVGAQGGSNWGPTWSPNNQMLAFFSDSGGSARPWIWNLSDQKARPLADLRPQVVEQPDVPRWTADSKSILFRAASERTLAIRGFQGTASHAVDESSALVLRSPEDSRHQVEVSANQTVTALGIKNMFEGDLVQVGIESGEIRTLTKGRAIYSYYPSPVGSRVVFTTAVGYEEGNTDLTLFDIVMKDLISGQEVIAAHEALLDNLGSALSWSPDASKLAYGTMVHENGTRYWIWSADQKSARPVGDAPRLSYPQYPLWNAHGDKLYVSSTDAVYVLRLNGEAASVVLPVEHFGIAALFSSERDRTIWSDSADGDAIYLAERNSESLELEVHRARLSNNSDERLLKLDAALSILPMDIMNGTRNGDTLAFPMESAAAPQDLWVVGHGFSGLRQLTHVNVELERYKYPERRMVRWTDFEGHELRGTLLMPSEYVDGRRYPLIVYVYGGERESRWAKQFSATSGGSVENMQLFATHGYAIFVPETVMGTQTPMLDLFKSLMPGIEKIIEMGVADANAIGVMGHSYGGYSVYSLLVQTSLFRAGVALSGGGNLLSYYGEMDPTGFPSGISWAEKGQGRMGDTPWNVRNRYIENSPFFYLDRVETPILIAHGDSDWHPASEDREMFVGLRRLGKTAEYAEYRGAGHRISAWRYADQIDLANRILGWFDKYLKPSPQATNPNDESVRRKTTGK